MRREQGVDNREEVKKVLNTSSVLSCCAMGMLLASASVAAADATEGFPPDETACTPRTQAMVKADLIKLAGRHRPELAWKLVSAFLCDSSPAAERSLVEASATVVMHRIASPNGVEEKPVRDIRKSIREQLPRAKAWNPEIKPEGRDLVVSYSISQYCWNFFGLRFDHGKWQLVLLGGGCD